MRVHVMSSNIYPLLRGCMFEHSFRNLENNDETKKNDSNNLHFQSCHIKPESNNKGSRDAGLSINFDNCFPASK